MDDDIMGNPEAELEPDAFEQLIIDFHVCHQCLVMLLSLVLTQILIERWWSAQGLACRKEGVGDL